MTAISAQNIYKSYSPAVRGGTNVTVLRDVSLTVNYGEWVALVGPSGSGKSSLMYCLSGLEPVDSGTAMVKETDVSSLRNNDVARMRREDVGFIFQAFNLVPSLTALENVALPLRLSNIRDARSRARDALEVVGLTNRAHHLPAALSGGQQQRVAIARVLASEPSVVFADEPTGSLDIASSEVVLRYLRSLVEKDRALVMATHNVDAAALADRVIVIGDGRIHDELSGAKAADISAAISRVHAEAAS